MKLLGNDGPDLRLDAARNGRPAIMGDTVRGGTAELTASVLNVPPGSAPFTLHVVKDGVAIASLAVTPPATTHQLTANGPGRYRLELRQGAVLWAVTTPIWVVD